MRVPSGVVYGAFGVTLLVAIVVLMRLMTALRRQFLAGFLVDRGQPAADAQRASFDSVDSALVLDVLERSAATAVTGVSSPPRVSLPEGEAAAAAKRPPLPVSRAELDRLCPPIALPQAKRGEEETPACAVCLEAMADGDIVRQMPACAHLFHDACIAVWASRKNRCPVCNQAIAPVDEVPLVAASVVHQQRRQQQARTLEHQAATGRLYDGAPPPTVSRMMVRAMSVGLNTRGP